MGLSAPSRSKGGTWPTALSMQPFSLYLFLRCAALTPVLTTDLPHKCSVTYYTELGLFPVIPQQKQTIFWGVTEARDTDNL